MPDLPKISLIIPAYYANKQLEEMTQRCLKSLDSFKGELILQIDEHGDGYSVTANAALRAAQGDIIVLGNNDLTFPDNWLTELLFPLNIGYDIATCWTTDQEVILEDRIENEPKFGSLFAMNRIVYETLGGFDEQFRGYFADTDYRRRALNTNFRIGKNLNLVVHHEGKATYKQVDPDDKEFLRSQRLFEAKHGFVE